MVFTLENQMFTFYNFTALLKVNACNLHGKSSHLVVGDSWRTGEFVTIEMDIDEDSKKQLIDE